MAIYSTTRSLRRALSYQCSRQHTALSPAVGVGWSWPSLQKRWLHFANERRRYTRSYTCARGTGRGIGRMVPSTSLQYRLGSSSSNYPPLPVQFLEAYDNQKFDPSTHQRNDVPFDQIDGKPPPADETQHKEKEYRNIPWNRSPDGDKWCLTTKGSNESDDSHSSYYSNDWIGSQTERWRTDSNDFDCLWSPSSSDTANKSNKSCTTKRILWSNWTEGIVRDPDVSPILFRYDNLFGNINDTETRWEKRQDRAPYPLSNSTTGSFLLCSFCLICLQYPMMMATTSNRNHWSLHAISLPENLSTCWSNTKTVNHQIYYFLLL